MGNKTIQRILKCVICERTPDDGEPLWDMDGEYRCEDCVDKDHECDETLEIFPGTKKALDNLSI